MDNHVTFFAGVLANNTRLRELRLGHNTTVISMGWQTLLTVLHMPTSVLEKLDLTGDDNDDHVLFSFATALATKKS